MVRKTNGLDIHRATAHAVANGSMIRRKSTDWPGDLFVVLQGINLVFVSADGRVLMGVYRPTVQDLLADDWEVKQ